MSIPPTSSVEVQPYACGRFALVRAGRQRPLHLTRDGVRDMIAKLKQVEGQMLPNTPAANPDQLFLPHTP